MKEPQEMEEEQEKEEEEKEEQWPPSVLRICAFLQTFKALYCKLDTTTTTTTTPTTPTTTSTLRENVQWLVDEIEKSELTVVPPAETEVLARLNDWVLATKSNLV